MMEDNYDLWRAYESGLETTTSFGSNLNSTPDSLVPYRKHNFNKKSSHFNNIDSIENLNDDNRLVKKKITEKPNRKDLESNHRYMNNESGLNAHSKSSKLKQASENSRKRDVHDRTSFGNSVGDKGQESSADSQSTADDQPQRVWKIELRREDMQLFDDNEAKLFRKLLRKLVRNNGSTVSASDVTPQQVSSQKSRNKSTSDSLQQSSQRKTKRRKRKIITRRDKNGVIIEKVYKPYEGEEGKEDVIVKYENGQPVASYTASQLASVGKHQAGSDLKYHKLTNGSIDSSDPFGSNSTTALSNNIQSLHTSQQDSTNALDSRDSASVDSSSETSSTKYPRRKRKNIYDESELNLPKSKYIAPMLNLSSVLAPVTEIQARKPEQNEKTSVEKLTNCVAGATSGIQSEKPVLETSDVIRSINDSGSEPMIKLPKIDSNQMLDKPERELKESNIDQLPANDVSTHINHMFAKPEGSLTVDVSDRNEQSLPKSEKHQKEDQKNIPGTMPAKFSARTKFVTTKKESGTFVDFDYFDRSSHSHGSSKLIQFLSDGGITKKGDIVDPYDCCEMLERVLKLKRYKDELSESSSDESCADVTKPENEKRVLATDGSSNEKGGVKTKTKEEVTIEEVSKKNSADNKAKTKVKSKKLNKRNNKNALGRFDSDDENIKSIVDKISRRYKADKDDKATSGQGLPHLKLPKNSGGAGNDTESRFSLINPGEDKVAQTLQFEQNSLLQLSNETALELLRNNSETMKNFCALCRKPPSNELGPLYGPYIFSHPTTSSSLLTNGLSENSSRCFSENKNSVVVPKNSNSDAGNSDGPATASCIHCGSGYSRPKEEGDQGSPDSSGQGQVWLHGQCLLWSPVTCLVASQLLSLEQTLEAVVESVCCVCSKKGATISCKVNKCPNSYHVGCISSQKCVADSEKRTVTCANHERDELENDNTEDNSTSENNALQNEPESNNNEDEQRPVPTDDCLLTTGSDVISSSERDQNNSLS